MSAVRRIATRARGARGAAYVEVLVIVGVVLTLGLVAVKTIGTGTDQQAAKEAACIESLGCAGAGSAGNVSNLGAMVGNPGAAGTPGSAGAPGTASAAVVSSNPLWDFGAGFLSEGAEMVTGTIHAVAHPIQTAEGIGYVAMHPGQAWDAIHAQWAGRSTAENLGRGLLEVLTLVGPGAATKLAKAAEVAGTLGDASVVATRAADAARLEHEAAEAAAAARATAARQAREAEEVCSNGVCTRPGNCFAAGTPVATADGEAGIETIAVGDIVMARDPETEETSAQRVAAVFVTPEKPVVDLALQGAPGQVEHLVVTGTHPFFVAGRGLIEVNDLAPGDVVKTLNGSARVVELTSLPRLRTVYNFEVENTHTYFVGHAGAWVHNVCRPEDTPRSIGDLFGRGRRAQAIEDARVAAERAARELRVAEEAVAGLPEVRGEVLGNALGQGSQYIPYRLADGRAAVAYRGSYAYELASARAAMEKMEAAQPGLMPALYGTTRINGEPVLVMESLADAQVVMHMPGGARSAAGAFRDVFQPGAYERLNSFEGYGRALDNDYLFVDQAGRARLGLPRRAGQFNELVDSGRVFTNTHPPVTVTPP